MINKNSLRRKTKGAVAIVLTTLAIALSGCASDKTAGDDSSKITIGIPQDIDGLDPH